MGLADPLVIMFGFVTYVPSTTIYLQHVSRLDAQSQAVNNLDWWSWESWSSTWMDRPSHHTHLSGCPVTVALGPTRLGVA